MTGIKRTMEALKYIAWGEILREKVCTPIRHTTRTAHNNAARILE
jgi:hypothetical protein